MQVGTPTEAGIMSRILHGSFDVVPFSKLNSEPGHRWVYNGVFLESVPRVAATSEAEGGAQAQPQPQPQPLLSRSRSPSRSPSPGPSPSPSPGPSPSPS